MEIEKFLKIPGICKEAVCFTDNPIFGAVVSSYFNSENEYFCLFDLPRLLRPDATNEVTRRTNALARLKPDKFIIADVTDEIFQVLSKRIPSKKMIRIKTIEEIDQTLKSNFNISKAEFLNCKSKQLALGLLLAKLGKKHLRINEKASEIDPKDIERFLPVDHMVVVDDMREVAPIISANYAYSIKARMMFFPETDSDDIDIIYDDIATSRFNKRSTRGMSSQRALDQQQAIFKSYTPSGNFKSGFVTFITKGIPYGYFFPETPSTHLFSYPDLGITIFNSLFFENEIKTTKSAIIIDPEHEDLGETETPVVSEQLNKRGIYVKELKNNGATVYQTGMYVQWYPYDLLFICSHAGKMGGKEFKIKFPDRSGKEHEIVVEFAASFGLTNEGEGDNRLVEVTHFIGFVSIDGFDWRDKKSKGVSRKTIEDFLAIPFDDWKIVERRNIEYVSRSAAISLADGDYQAMFHLIAGQELPIIFNNACVSFYEFAGKFFFAGARGYIGTLTPVGTISAKKVAEDFFRNLSPNKPLPFLLWETQRKVFSDYKDRVYVHVGTHFCNINPPKEDPVDFLKRQMRIQVAMILRKLSNETRADVKRNSINATKFLKELISRF